MNFNTLARGSLGGVGGMGRERAGSRASDAHEDPAAEGEGPGYFFAAAACLATIFPAILS